jgi:hypothetical protein
MPMRVFTAHFPSEIELFRGEKGMVPAEGLEPTRSCDHWILSPARLPFRHAGVLEGAKEYEHRAEPQPLPTKSSGCMLRGGPKISRKIIASRKPDVDLSMVTRSRGFAANCAAALVLASTSVIDSSGEGPA